MRRKNMDLGVALSLVTVLILMHLTVWFLTGPAPGGDGTRVRAALDDFETAVSDFVESVEWVGDWARLFHRIDRFIQPLRQAARGA